MAKAKKPTARKSPAKKSAAKSAKSAKSSSARKPTKKTTSKKPERKSAVKPAPKTTAKSPATSKPVAAAPAPAKATAAASKAPAAKAAAPKKPAAKKIAAAATSGMPMIDTNLAAQNAAAMLINRPVLENAGDAPAQKESSTFKNLKEQLAHPKPTGLGNLFGPSGDSKKSGGHFSAHQEKGHNQTFGGLNKTGVPRRTNG